MRISEDAECIALNGYLRLLEPLCEFTYTHIPNGGWRHKAVAAHLKAMGVRAGVWDYYFRAATCPTLWIEMKHGRNDTTPQQNKWRELLAPLGDLFEVCYSAEEALRKLIEHRFIPADMVFFGPMAVSIRLVPT